MPITAPWDRPRFRALLARARAGRTDTECWPWPGNINTTHGYGRYGQAHAHVLAFLSTGRKIPPGHHVDHACHNPDTCSGGRTCPHRPCVNPAHLQALTPLENWERGCSPPRRNRDRTTCGVCDRPYDTVSRTRRDGIVRRCSTCTSAANQRSVARRSHDVA